MATTTIGPTRTFKSAGDLAGKQNYVVYINAKGIVTIASAATHALMGTVVNKPQTGAGANIEVQMPHGGGTGKVIAGGSISIGDKLTADSAGKAVATTTTGNIVFGVAIMPGDANDVIEYMPHFEKHA